MQKGETTMGYTIEKWEKIISKMDNRTLSEAELSLHTLLSWIAFQKAYGWTALDVLKTLIRAELNKRNEEWGTIIFSVNPVYKKSN